MKFNSLAKMGFICFSLYISIEPTLLGMRQPSFNPEDIRKAQQAKFYTEKNFSTDQKIYGDTLTVIQNALNTLAYKFQQQGASIAWVEPLQDELRITIELNNKEVDNQSKKRQKDIKVTIIKMQKELIRSILSNFKERLDKSTITSEDQSILIILEQDTRALMTELFQYFNQAEEKMKRKDTAGVTTNIINIDKKTQKVALDEIDAIRNGRLQNLDQPKTSGKNQPPPPSLIVDYQFNLLNKYFEEINRLRRFYESLLQEYNQDRSYQSTWQKWHILRYEINHLYSLLNRITIDASNSNLSDAYFSLMDALDDLVSDLRPHLVAIGDESLIDEQARELLESFNNIMKSLDNKEKGLFSQEPGATPLEERYDNNELQEEIEFLNKSLNRVLDEFIPLTREIPSLKLDISALQQRLMNMKNAIQVQIKRNNERTSTASDEASYQFMANEIIANLQSLNLNIRENMPQEDVESLTVQLLSGLKSALESALTYGELIPQHLRDRYFGIIMSERGRQLEFLRSQLNQGSSLHRDIAIMFDRIDRFFRWQ